MTFDACRHGPKLVHLLLVVFFLLVGGMTDPLQAQETSQYFSPLLDKTLAVTRWQPVGEEAEQQTWLADSLQELSSKDLSRVSEINLLPVEDYRERMEESGLEDLNPNESDNARKISKATGAQILLIGTYQIKDRRIQLSAAFYDTEKQETLAATNKLGSMGEIKSLETNLLMDLLQKTGITLGSTERDWLNRKKTLGAPDLEFDQVEPRPEIFRREKKGPEAVLRADTVGGEYYEKSMYVGLHYPGASIGFRTSPSSSFEIRGSSESDITVLGGRYNFQFYKFGSSNLFMGVQGSHIDFVGEVSEGTGLLGGGYFGLQQFFTPYMSFRADFGSYFISLEDDATGVSNTGLGFALNTGLAIHFL